MHCFLYLLTLLCLSFPLPAQAASQASPAYFDVQVRSPYSGNDTLSLFFEPDEALCKDKYGNTWMHRCSAALGQAGAPARGIRISPNIPGDWRWTGDSSIEFQPSGVWPAGTSYSVDLQELSLPSYVQTDTRHTTFATPPLAVLKFQGTLWIDPDIKGERAISFDITFNTPPDRQSVENRALLETKGAPGTLSSPQFIWNETGTSCVVKARIKHMPAGHVTATLDLPGVAAQVERSGTLWTVPKGQNTARQQVTIPGIAGLFSIRTASLQPVTDASLNGGYQLNIETSLLVRPEDMLKSLTAFQLPEKMQPGSVTSTIWTELPSLDEQILERSTKVSLESLQPADQPTTKMSFKVHADQGSYVIFRLPAGFGPEPQASLSRPWSMVLHAAPLKPELEILQPGHLLVLSGDRTLDLHSSGLTSIHWKVSRVLKPFLGMLSMINDPFASSDATLIDSFSETRQGEISLKRTEPGTPQFSTLDVSALGQEGYGLLQLQLTGMDGSEKKIETSRFLLVTDLGLIVKTQSDGSRCVFVCSLSQGSPVTGAHIQILGVNGLPVASAMTDNEGKAMLPSVNGLSREKRPVAVTAQWGDDLAWISLEDNSRTVDYSRFPIQGQTGGADGINAYVFAERGVFRPGENLHFGVVLRRGDWKKLPPDMPLVAELHDPSERTVMTRTFTAGLDGLAEFTWKAPESSPTGRYRLDIQTPEDNGTSMVLGSGAVRMEEFQPDTMNISASIQPIPGKGWTDASNASAEVFVKNLYGAPAADRRIRGELSVSPTMLSFPGYESYTFHDALPYRGSALTLDLPEVRSDSQGHAVLPLPLEKFRGGTMLCNLFIEGFEPGEGRSVSTVRTFLVSPLKAVLGYRPSGAGCNLNFIPKGNSAALEFIALGSDLSPTDPGALTFSVSELRSITSLVTDAQGRYYYDETPVNKELYSTTQNLDAHGALTWTIPTDKVGEFLLNVKDGNGMSLAKIPFVVAGNDDLRLSARDTLPSGSLRLRTDTSDYAPGDTIRVFLSSPYDGWGLLTLERDHVAAFRWVHVPSGNSVQELTIPQDFEGRAYINISLARNLSSPEIFMQPHVYAVAPITVNGHGRDLGLDIEVPQRMLPGGVLQASVTSKTPGKALIFAVDEGILQLTSFATPDPLRYLLEDRALEVETRQLFDLLMPEHSLLPLPPFGGDMGLSGGRFFNPFKRKGEAPLCWWSGIVDVGPQARNFSIPVPGYYQGSVRVMVVAASPDKAGKADARVEIRGPETLTPQFPMFVSPGDTFEASLAVANNTDQVKNYTVSMKTESFDVIEGPSTTVSVGPEKEYVVKTRLRARDILGNANVEFTLTDDHKNKTSRNVSLSIRPATPLRDSLEVGVTDHDIPVHVERNLYPYQAKTSLSISSLPLPALKGLFRYLDNYPYSCVEQRISRALPYALLSRLPEIIADSGYSQKELEKRSQQRMDDAIQGIQSGLTWSGVGLWPDAPSDILITAYAADYLLTLHETGLLPPGNLLNNICATLEKAVDHTPASITDARAMAYGLWVLTREGRITARSIENLIVQMDERIPGWEGDVISTLLAGCCAIMRMSDDAERLISLYRSPGKDFQQGGMIDQLGVLALRSSVLARSFPDRLSSEREELSSEIMDVLNRDSYVSLSAALGIRALLDISQNSVARELTGVELFCTSMQSGFESTPSDLIKNAGMLSLSVPGCASYKMHIPEGLPALYWEVSAQGFDRRPDSEALSQGIELSREYRDVHGAPVTKVHQGDEVTVVITIHSYGGPLDNVVVTDLLPGGFEQNLREDISSNRIDRREDRTLFFLSTGVQPVTLQYSIRAVNKGTFTLPPAQAEALYNRSMRAHTPAGNIIVE